MSNDLSYFERLVVLGWITLEMRRIYADLVLCYKIINGHIAIDSSEFFSPVSSVMATRGHRFKMATQFSKNSIRHNFFSVRVVPIWNDLPSCIVDATSISSFKNLLIKYDVSKYCKIDLD